MWFVQLSIPGDEFFEAMCDVSGWLADQRIDTANFAYSRDAAGAVSLSVSFPAAAEAGRFAERFALRLTPADVVSAAAGGRIPAPRCPAPG